MIRAVGIFLLVSLSGCTAIFGDTFHDRAQDYLTAETQPAMTPIADQPELPLQDRYVIPEITPTLASAIKLDEDGDFVVPQPIMLTMEDDSQEITSLSQMQDTGLNPRLERDGAGTQVLRLEGQFGLAWIAVSEAITESPYTLTDLNRSTGTYYITIFDPEAEQPEKSLWQWLTNSSEKGVEIPYLVKMNRSRLGVYLSLQKDLETLADDELAQRFLTDLKNLLIQ